MKLQKTLHSYRYDKGVVKGVVKLQESCARFQVSPRCCQRRRYVTEGVNLHVVIGETRVLPRTS